MILIEISLFLNAILLSIATTTINANQIQDKVDQLSKSTQESLLKSLLSTSSSVSREAVTNVTAEQWCCKIDPGVTAVTQTRQITYYEIQYGRHKCGYDSCGFLGWSRCTRFCSETWSESKNGVETYIVKVQNVCPKNELTCCEQHMYLLGHCFSFAEIYENQQLLSDLHELGIVIPGPSVG